MNEQYEHVQTFCQHVYIYTAIMSDQVGIMNREVQNGQ